MSSKRILSPSDTGVFRDPNGNITGSVDYHPQVSPVVTFREATVHQIQDALRDEEYHGSNPTLSLAKQGLFNANDNTVFHPNHVKWLSEASGVLNMDVSFGGIEACYSLSRETHNKILEVFEKNPSRMWIQ